MKRLLTLLLVAMLVVGMVTAVGAQDIKVTIDGKDQSFESLPVNVGGRILVPMRSLFEALGAEVTWDSETRTAIGTKGNVIVRIPIGSTNPTINGQVNPIDVPAKIVDDRTFIPLRFVGEALGAQVGWQAETRRVIVNTQELTPEPDPVQEDLVLHFIDVGQADSILIEGPTGKVMLIDAGTRSAGEKVVSYLKQAGINSIDIFVGTHPHEDHIGGFIEVAENFPVDLVLDPGFAHTTFTYERYLTYIDENNIAFQTPRAGQKVFFDPAVEVRVLHPEMLMGDPNNSSIVLRLDHGQLSFLFTGDAEKEAEAQMLARDREQLAAEVLKVGHHGSRTSTTQAFLDAVAPEVAVIQAGEGNRYGHPHQEVLDRLANAGVDIYRNDIAGDIVITSDGQSYQIISGVRYDHKAEPTPEPTPDPEPGVGRININTASFEDLQEITGVGPAIAQNIIDYRNAHGPFTRIEQIKNVSGIGDARFEDMKDEITVN